MSNPNTNKAKPATPSPKDVTTPKFRVSFPALFKAKAFQNQEPKYSIVMLFDKDSADLTAMKKAVFAAATERWGAKEKWPKNLRLPFRDGDAEKGDQPGYENTTFVTATSKQRPMVVDQKRNPISEEDDTIYAGCYARAHINAFAYPKEGVKGISPGVTFGLNSVQKLADGERFSGRKKIEDVFDAVEEEVDDESNFGSDNADDELGF